MQRQCSWCRLHQSRTGEGIPLPAAGALLLPWGARLWKLMSPGAALSQWQVEGDSSPSSLSSQVGQAWNEFPITSWMPPVGLSPGCPQQQPPPHHTGYRPPPLSPLSTPPALLPGFHSPSEPLVLRSETPGLLLQVPSLSRTWISHTFFFLFLGISSNWAAHSVLDFGERPHGRMWEVFLNNRQGSGRQALEVQGSLFTVGLALTAGGKLTDTCTLLSPSLDFGGVWFLFGNLSGEFGVLRDHVCWETWCVSLAPH